ncbi:MAG: hypothetical protein ONB30_04985 [candidate division KSB1 bacterium]|nr:hypothetical protein [candidate division KSB1 bacterium]
MSEIDNVVRNSLTDFTNRVFTSAWWGKEREAVSLFAFGHLIKHCRPGSVLYDPAQIGIEVRVPKADSVGKKAEICKDLVIWPKPGLTCWNENEWPVAILEWKANQPQVSADDVAWLLAFSAKCPTFVGYAICLDLKQRNFRLSCTRVQQQKVQNEWLVL